MARGLLEQALWLRENAPEERVAIGMALEEREKEKAASRKKATQIVGGKPPGSEKFTEPEKGEALEEREKEKARERKAHGFTAPGKSKNASEKFAEAFDKEKGRALEKVARAVADIGFQISKFGFQIHFLAIENLPKIEIRPPAPCLFLQSNVNDAIRPMPDETPERPNNGGLSWR